jgi:hypothetical protein
VTYATPIAPGRSRIIARFPFKFKSKDGAGGRGRSLSSRLVRLFFGRFPAWLTHIQQNNVIDDDNIFLHHQVGMGAPAAKFEGRGITQKPCPMIE